MPLTREVTRRVPIVTTFKIAIVLIAVAAGALTVSSKHAAKRRAQIEALLHAADLRDHRHKPPEGDRPWPDPGLRS
jgi:hypothetical protein